MTHTTPTRVMIFGTFDHFHAGHEFLIENAKKMGDELIAVVARDETVKKIKKQLPDHAEKERLAKVKAHPLVDKAILGNRDDKFKVVLKYRPDIIALGYDQFVFTYMLPQKIIEHKLNTTIKRIDAYKPDIFKSSLIRKKNSSSSCLKK